jgi:enterochelin esterase family protein
MRTLSLAALAIALALLAPGGARAQGATVQAQPAGPQIDSPRLTALWQDLQAGNAASLDSFWQEIQGKAPLVEPDPTDATKRRVTFVYKGGSTTQTVFLFGGLPPKTLENGGFPSFVVAEKQFALLPGTNLWYRTEHIPGDARFGYYLGVLNGSANNPRYINDPLNRISIGGGNGSGVELPNAPPVPWIVPDATIPQGKLVRQLLKSPTLKYTRGFTVYTPPGYDPAGNAYGLLLLFDGEWYRDPQQMNAPVILDNLIAKQQIVPLVAVFVENNTGSEDRTRDLGNSPDFADFLAEELVPWVRQNYHVSSDPARTIVGGSSLGGLMSSYSALRHPEVIGNVLSQSGAYWVYEGWPKVAARIETEPGWLTHQFATTPKLPLRFYLSVGRFERFVDYTGSSVTDLREENERFRDVLEAKGYPVTYEEMNATHDPLNWRSTLPNGLMALAGPPKPSP